MKLYFSISECCMTDEPVPQRIADAIMLHHIIPQSHVRAKLGFPIYVNGSCWRSLEYETKMKRDPNSTGKDWSQHTFYGEGIGAFDGSVIPAIMGNYAEGLLSTPYSRHCYYPEENFIHSDYKFPERGKRLFINTNGTWEQKNESDWLHFIQSNK